MITGRFSAYGGSFALFSHDEIEVWNSADAISDIDALASLTEEDTWCQTDILLGDWVVDTIDYDPKISPDMIIMAKRPSGMGIVFLLKASSRSGKTGYLMRTILSEQVEQSLFGDRQIGEKIDCKLVLVNSLNAQSGKIYMLPFSLESTVIEGRDIVALTIPKSKNKKVAA